MAQDYDTLKRGGIWLPVRTGTGLSLLQVADPAIFFALEYFTFVLEKTLGPALEEYGAAAGIEIPKAVAHAVPITPRQILDQGNGEFPLLACYRVRGTTDDVTLALRHGTYKIAVEYILPPLTAGQAEILVPLLTAAHAALDEWTCQGFDPAFAPTGGTEGDEPFMAPFACVEKIEFSDVTWGQYQPFEGLPFYSVTMTAEIRERSEDISSLFDPYEGANVTAGVADGDSPSVDVTVLATQQPPTFTSASAATLSVAGGSPLTLTGTLFKNPARVWIGADELVDVVVVSPTTITATSVAVDAYLAGSASDIEIECDGQSVVASSVITFTA